MSSNWVFDIKKMQQKYGVHDWMKEATPFELKKYIRFRYDFLKEEMAETDEAIIMDDAEELVDGLIDICVVAIGTLEAIGVDPYKAWDTVLKANMTKEAGVKKSRPNPLGIPDMIKPKGWKGPSHKGNHGRIAESYEQEWTEKHDAAIDELVDANKEKYGRAVETVPEMMEKPKAKPKKKAKKKATTKKSKMEKMLESNKARTEIAGEVNTKWTPDAQHYTPGPGPLDGAQAKIDWTKDSEYIRLYGEGDETNK